MTSFAGQPSRNTASAWELEEDVWLSEPRLFPMISSAALLGRGAVIAGVEEAAWLSEPRIFPMISASAQAGSRVAIA